MRVRPVKPVFMAAGGVAGADYLRGVLLMSDLRKAAQDLLHAWDLPFGFHPAQARFEALRAALAQPDPVEVRQGWEYMREKGLLQAPVAWMYEWENQKLVGFLKLDELESARTPLYTAPPQRKPLTEEEIVAVLVASAGMTVKANDVDLRFARAIEKAHGIGEHNA